MTARSIKAGVKTMLVDNLPALPPLTSGEAQAWQIYERYPRRIDNNRGDVIIIWMEPGRESRFAGGGSGNGPYRGVKRVYWTCRIHIIVWGTDVEQDYDHFEDLVDTIVEICRSNNAFSAYEPPVGSQVLNFAETILIENTDPQYVAQYLKYQTILHVTVEEIYNA